MKVSVVISVYQSHEAVRRQMLHFEAMCLPADVEFVLVDDGCRPPLAVENYTLPRLRVVHTGSTLAWTQGIGRNIGAQVADGEYLLFTDIDHILSRAALQDVRDFRGDRMFFPRYLGVLTASGELTQDIQTLLDYGLDEQRLHTRRGLYASVHQNTFAIWRNTFDVLGGYAPEHSQVGYHPISRKGDDCYFNAKWNRWARERGIRIMLGSPIYMFPVGRYHVRGETNPKGLFHNLSYDGQRVLHKGDEDAGV